MGETMYLNILGQSNVHLVIQLDSGTLSGIHDVLDSTAVGHEDLVIAVVDREEDTFARDVVGSDVASDIRETLTREFGKGTGLGIDLRVGWASGSHLAESKCKVSCECPSCCRWRNVCWSVMRLFEGWVLLAYMDCIASRVLILFLFGDHHVRWLSGAPKLYPRVHSDARSIPY